VTLSSRPTPGSRSVWREAKRSRVPQALAATQDPKDRHRSRNHWGERTPRRIRPWMLQKADQVGRALQESLAKKGIIRAKPCSHQQQRKLVADRLSISPGDEARIDSTQYN